MDLAEELKQEEVRKAASEARTASINAEKAELEAQQQRVAALIPDFSKTDSGSLEVKGEQPMFGAMLAALPLTNAPERLAADVQPRPGEDDSRVLITNDAPLAVSAGVYWDVVTAVDQLTAIANDALAASKPAETDEPIAGETPAAQGIAPLVGAAAAAPAALQTAVEVAAKTLPGLISLFAAHTTVAVTTVTASDLGAGLAVAGALRKAVRASVLVHDSFRLLPHGHLADSVAELIAKRGLLGHEKAAMEAAQPPNSTMVKALSDAIAGIDAFVSFLTTVPAGATRSPLVAAALREQVHEAQGEEPSFSHVLVVKSEGGSTTEETQRRWILGDHFTVASSLTVDYALILATDSRVLAAGSANGSVVGSGKIGEKLTFDVK